MVILKVFFCFWVTTSWVTHSLVRIKHVDTVRNYGTLHSAVPVIPYLILSYLTFSDSPSQMYLLYCTYERIDLNHRLTLRTTSFLGNKLQPE